MEQTVALTLPDEETFKSDIQAINKFQQIVKANMIPGQDYGVIPGTTKPTLLKPGAEKIAKLLGLADHYEILDRQEDWQRGFFRYLIKCQLITVRNDIVISEGLGECNSMESKYRWRESKRKCPKCDAEAIIKGKEEYGGGWLCFAKQGGCGAKFPDGDESIESQTIGRVENEDIYSQVNTILKMAKKRALVDASLSAGRLSQVFTQDIEDIPGFGTVEGSDEEPVDKSQHWCKLHDTAFFKKGKMTSFAHPIEGSEPKEWCYEPSKKAKPAKQAEKDKDLFPQDPPHATAAAEAAEQATAQRQAEEVKHPSEDEVEPGQIDPDWLKEMLPKVKWTEKTAATWLVSKFKVQGGLLKDVLTRLTEGQRQEFVKEIQDRLEML